MSGIDLTRGRGKVEGVSGWVGLGMGIVLGMHCRDARGSKGSGMR